MRIRRTYCPRPALILTDTPRPDCLDCEGNGGNPHDYADDTGEYAGTYWESCTCWNEDHCWLVLPLPRALRRTPPGGYSDEPPF
ncbi:hypothetical protein CG747_10565 [Streptomyces sp. CB02959]|uniref:hypothetical protein n=1 Tax=Streptomyces sp. CB02959 TaxID=2020330 RepID=UPI000C27CB71|nr:hypothetical protein [Streptomyces sp. CB02959]PJN40770.1 hypothetical protein CG747_10565 [Streptomyces sp. CB02959]